MPRMLKYQEIEGWLRQELSGGRFAPGDRFHSENDAARRFGVTAVTARKAFAPLEQAGYIEVVEREELGVPLAVRRRRDASQVLHDSM